jgi:uncharacterized protein YjbI with pentapeptide repeats
MDGAIFGFIRSEIALQEKARIGTWQRLLARLIGVQQRQGMPMQKLEISSFGEMNRQACNAEAALLMVLGACAARTEEGSVIEWPDLENSGRLWVQRLSLGLIPFNVTHCLVRVRLGGDLCGMNLFGAELRGADLRGAKLILADLRGANLHGANLRGADLGDAILTDAILTDAILTDAILFRTDLTRARLQGANLDGALLTLADLTGANLENATMPAGWRRVTKGKPRVTPGRKAKKGRMPQ